MLPDSRIGRCFGSACIADVPCCSGQRGISVLVLGGNSAVGAAAIQLLRLALPIATICTTSSPKDHSRLISLGTIHCFDRSLEDASATRAVMPAEQGFDAILDAVAAAASQPSVLDALSLTRLRIYSQVQTGQDLDVPKSINSTVILARQLFGVVGGMTAITNLATMLENGIYRLPVKVEVVGQTLGSIQHGPEKLRDGVSGTKYVVTL